MQYVATFNHKIDIQDKETYFNSVCYGGDLIGGLIEPRLIEANYTIDLFAQEDWGWFIWFNKDRNKFSIDIGLEDEEK